MELSSQILSDITIHMKYARYKDDKKRRETWQEIVYRNRDMHLDKYPHLSSEIVEVYNNFVLPKKVLPSMRSLQFAGKPIKISPNRLYNCAFLPMDDWRAFSEIMFLLLGGSGVGFSVQKHHVDKLPEIKKPKKSKRFLVGDSIEGWADSIKYLIKAYLSNGALPIFDFSDIRPKGSRLVTSGGKAPGPEPLKECLLNIKNILDRKSDGEKLKTIEVHDIVCYIADGVLAGGIRRAALISLFSFDDEDMIASKQSNIKVDKLISAEHPSYTDKDGLKIDTSKMVLNFIQNGIEYKDVIIYKDEKSGLFYDMEQYKSDGTFGWWVANPQRGRSNNSALALRHRIKKRDFDKFWKRIKDSHSGEPGIYFSNDMEWGANPSLRKGTKVLTTGGIFPIEELQDKEFYVKNLDGKLSNARCWLSGKDKRLWKIKLFGGQEYYATKEHKWAVWDGHNYIKLTTDKLVCGDMLPIIRENKLFDGNLGNYSDGFTLGWQLGDGWISVRGDNGKNQHGFVVSNKDNESNICNIIEDNLHSLGLSCKFNQRNNNTLELNTQSIALDERMQKYGFYGKQYGLPVAVWKSGSEEFRKGIIDGLFSSDGHVEKKKKRISLVSKHKKLIDDVSELLGFYGIKTTVNSRYCKLNGKKFVSFYLRILEGESVKHFRNLFKLTNKYKQERLDSYEYRYNIVSNNQIEIISVEETDMCEDVWDISVYDNTHCFQISKCITGNCVEIGLRPFQFCNLVEINGNDIKSQEDFNQRSKAASFIATLQAGHTDFHYLRDIWKKTTEKDALLGVGITGIAGGKLDNIDLREGATQVIEENKRVAKLIGIKSAARTTCVKPSGTSSLVLGTSSGIHAWHDEYYIRRIRVGKNESIYQYLLKHHPELVEDDVFKPTIQAVISVPQKAPNGAMLRTESAMTLLERVKRFNDEWVATGHVDGHNKHNVSCTVSAKDDEWDDIGKWMWENRNSFNGLSVLPYNGGTYKQAPFESISKSKYYEMVKILHEIKLEDIIELEDMTDLKGEVACSGNSCEIT